MTALLEAEFYFSSFIFELKIYFNLTQSEIVFRPKDGLATMNVIKKKKITMRATQNLLRATD